jgi:hypothetical protein
MLTGALPGDADAAKDRDLGDLRALAGVSKFPVRIKCALLGFDALQEAMPALIDVAAAVDDTMRLLSILPNVDYQPDVPLDEALTGVAESLESMPAQLRAQRTTLLQAERNLVTLSGDIAETADGIDAIAAAIETVRPLLAENARAVEDAAATLQRARNQIHLEAAAVLLGVAALAMALLQGAAAWVGSWLLRNPQLLSVTAASGAQRRAASE